jgi:hypothetical protein
MNIVTNPVVEKLVVDLLSAIVSAIGIDGLRSLLQGHPLTAGQIIASERAAGDAVIETLEDEKFGPKTKT